MKRVVACLGLLFALEACGGGDDTASPALDKVRAVVIPVMIMSPLFIAQAEGYFADEGLDVEFVRLTRNIDAIPALAQGDVDVGAGQAAISMFNAISGGARLRGVAGLGRLAGDGCTFHGMVARSEVFPDGAQTDPEAFVGRRAEIDVTLPHAYWFERALQPGGVTLEDLEVVDVPMSATVDAFINGSFDVTGIDEPRLSLLMRSGSATLWRGTEEIVPDYQVSFLFFGPSLLDERPDVGERFIAAYLRAVRQYNEGKTERNLEILEQSMRWSKVELEQMCWVTMDEDGRMFFDGLVGYQEWALARGLVERVLTEDEMIDRRFIDAAVARSPSRVSRTTTRGSEP